jgi:hypothetical protein
MTTIYGFQGPAKVECSTLTSRHPEKLFSSEQNSLMSLFPLFALYFYFFAILLLQKNGVTLL